MHVVFRATRKKNRTEKKPPNNRRLAMTTKYAITPVATPRNPLFFLFVLVTVASMPGTAEAKCADDDDRLFAWCDEWFVAAVVLLSILGALILGRMLMTFVSCEVERDEVAATDVAVTVTSSSR